MSEETKKEPVYSLACQRDGLWGLSGIGVSFGRDFSSLAARARLASAD